MFTCAPADFQTNPRRNAHVMQGGRRTVWPAAVGPLHTRHVARPQLCARPRQGGAALQTLASRHPGRKRNKRSSYAPALRATWQMSVISARALFLQCHCHQRGAFSGRKCGTLHSVLPLRGHPGAQVWGGGGVGRGAAEKNAGKQKAATCIGGVLRGTKQRGSRRWNAIDLLRKTDFGAARLISCCGALHQCVSGDSGATSLCLWLGSLRLCCTQTISTQYQLNAKPPLANLRKEKVYMQRVASHAREARAPKLMEQHSNPHSEMLCAAADGASFAWCTTDCTAHSRKLACVQESCFIQESIANSNNNAPLALEPVRTRRTWHSCVCASRGLHTRPSCCGALFVPVPRAMFTLRASSPTSLEAPIQPEQQSENHKQRSDSYRMRCGFTSQPKG